MRVISFQDGEAKLDWLSLVSALEAGHRLPKAEVADSFLYRGDDTLLTRSAWIDGLGLLTKSATVFPGNPSLGQPMIGGGAMVFGDRHGALESVVDFHLITKWKTAGDSLLGALKLQPKATRILIVGAGTVGTSVRQAFGAGYPDAKFSVWNRSPAGAEALAGAYPNTTATTDLERAVKEADIIVTGTMSTEPVIKGDWLGAGQHLNMIGAYRPDMREADDAALQKARVFVDSFDTTLDHIGELKIPLASGAIERGHVLADYYDMDMFTPRGLTVFKNGGGAHLDLMTARHILDVLG